MRVLDALSSSRTRWRAMFVGNGPLAPQLRRWAANEKHRDNVRICTDVRHDEVSAYINAMSLLAAPSQTTRRWREQFGRMIIEAFACGVPVVGSSSGEIPHVIGDSGVIVDERDEAAWTAAIARLLESPGCRKELCDRGLARAPRYSWSVVAAEHLRFFEEILDGAGAA
jgi:glycosyltransferase involved in cell wall biosynthesis